MKDEEKERLERRKELKEKQSYRDCVICKNKFKFKESKHSTVCDNCYDNTDKSLGTKYLVYCNHCDFYYFCNYNLTACPKCKLHSFKKECVECHKIFIAHHSSVEICDYCMKPFSVRYCDQLMNDPNSIIKDGFILLPIEMIEGKLIRECRYCHIEFSVRSGPHVLCGCCYRIRTCSCCGEKYVNTRTNLSPVNGIRCKNNVCSRKCHSKNIYKTTLSKITPNIDISKERIKSSDLYEVSNNLSLNYDLNDLQEINDNNFMSFDYPGLWCKIDAKTNQVLDVCLTQNISTEYRFHKNKILNPHNSKYRKLKKYNIKCLFIKRLNFWRDGLIDEMKFALYFKAKYWSPAPGKQMKLSSKVLKGEGNEFKNN